MTTHFVAPTEDDLVDLARRWLDLEALVREAYDASLDLSVPGLDLLQRVLTDGLLDPAEPYGFECLGVALGRVLAEQVPGLDWAAAEDEAGRTVVLRHGISSFHVDVVPMVRERVERGEPVDVRALYTWVEALVEDHVAGQG